MNGGGGGSSAWSDRWLIESPYEPGLFVSVNMQDRILIDTLKALQRIEAALTQRDPGGHSVKA